MQDNIRVFVENGLEEEPRKMRSSLFLVNFFPMLGVAYGLLLGNVYRVFSALIVFSITIAFILIFVLTKKNTKIRVIKADICFNLFTAINYLLFAMILHAMYNKVHFNLLLLFLPLIFVATLTILLTVKFVKNKVATASKNRNVSIGAISGTTTIATYLILKRINVNIEQNTALLIGTVLLVILSSLFVALGVISVVKLYYINKLHITLGDRKCW